MGASAPTAVLASGVLPGRSPSWGWSWVRARPWGGGRRLLPPRASHLDGPGGALS